MTEEKSTIKKTPAAKKTAVAAAATAAPAGAEAKAPAVKKAAPAAAEKKAPAKKATQVAVETESSPLAPTECATIASETTQAKPSAEDRYRMVQSAAYFIAEKNGFQHGCDAEYWARAEREVALELGEAEA